MDAETPRRRENLSALPFSATPRLRVKWALLSTYASPRTGRVAGRYFRGRWGEGIDRGRAARDGGGVGGGVRRRAEGGGRMRTSRQRGVCWSPSDWPSPSYRTVIRVPEPRTAFARALSRLYPTMEIKPGVHPTAVVGKDVELGAMVYIGPHAVVGDGSRIGVATSIGAGCVHRQARRAGRRVRAASERTVYDNVDIGRGSILHSGVVIGADGFGYVMEHDRWHKFPQVGPRGDRGLRGDRGQFVRGPRGAGRHLDRRRAPSSTTWCTWGTIAASGGTWWWRRRPASRAGWWWRITR